jgi:hypothetical protein
MKSGSLTLLEASGLLQHCAGIALPFSFMKNELGTKRKLFTIINDYATQQIQNSLLILHPLMST